MKKNDELKQFRYNWDEDRWLLHLVKGKSSSNKSFEIIRIYRGEKSVKQENHFDDAEKRFILTRESPEETSVIISHKSDLNILVYEILDRAHFPSEPIYINNG